MTSRPRILPPSPSPPMKSSGTETRERSYGHPRSIAMGDSPSPTRQPRHPRITAPEESPERLRSGSSRVKMESSGREMDDRSRRRYDRERGIDRPRHRSRSPERINRGGLHSSSQQKHHPQQMQPPQLGPVPFRKRCYEFAATGSCNRGRACKFEHIRGSPQAQLGVPLFNTSMDGSRFGGSHGQLPSAFPVPPPVVYIPVPQPGHHFVEELDDAEYFYGDGDGNEGMGEEEIANSKKVAAAKEQHREGLLSVYTLKMQLGKELADVLEELKSKIELAGDEMTKQWLRDRVERVEADAKKCQDEIEDLRKNITSQ